MAIPLKFAKRLLDSIIPPNKKMKANNGSGNNQSRDSWETPRWLFDKLTEQYGFTLDCCASEGNQKCGTYCLNFKTTDVTDKYMCWMNPPFSKAEEMFKHFFKVVEEGVAIYRCDNLETKVWQQVILPKATWIFIPDKRIAYEGMEGTGSRFPSALIGLNVEPPKKLGGITLKPSQSEESLIGIIWLRPNFRV